MNVSSNLKSTSDEVADIPAGKILAEKANAFDKHIKPMFEDLEKYEAFLSKVRFTILMPYAIKLYSYCKDITYNKNLI